MSKSVITYVGCESGERGEIVKFNVDGMRYEYDVGFYFMEKISNRALHNPGGAFNMAKQAGTLAVKRELLEANRG